MNTFLRLAAMLAIALAALSPALGDVVLATEVSPPAKPAAATRIAQGEAFLYEAAGAGTISFEGTVDWGLKADADGKPMLAAHARIGDRLDTSVLIHANTEPTLPASHLIEIAFEPGSRFTGGSVAALPGALVAVAANAKGKPLIGASARAKSGGFFFALSQSAADLAANTQLLGSLGYLDLAIVYGDGTKAVLVLDAAVASEAFKDFIARTTPGVPAN